MVSLKSAFSLPKAGLDLGHAPLLAVSSWDVQKANANSNLQEHMVQRGKVDKRQDRERTGAQNSVYHIIIFMVHVELTQ